jgi:hypothetical protein
MNWNFINMFWKNNNIKHLMKIRPVGAELFYTGGQTEGQADRRTDRQTDGYDESNSRFSHFCESALKLLNS